MSCCVFCGVSPVAFTDLWVFSRSAMEPLTRSSRCCLCSSLQKWLHVLPGPLHFRATTTMNRHEPRRMQFTSLTESDKISQQGCTRPGELCTLHRGGVSPTHSLRGACPGCQRAPRTWWEAPLSFQGGRRVHVRPGNGPRRASERCLCFSHHLGGLFLVLTLSPLLMTIIRRSCTRSEHGSRLKHFYMYTDKESF